MSERPVVLVVDDNYVIREICRRQLDKLGLLCQTVSNGREAVAAVRNHQYSLVIMDIQMPVMDGLEATKEIRRFISAEELPIVALTAHADEDQCLKSGMNDFIAKPMNIEVLRRVLDRWLPQMFDRWMPQSPAAIQDQSLEAW